MSNIPSTMRAIFAEPNPENGGGVDALHLKHVPVPEPDDGEVLIKIAATGINRPDIFQRQGNYDPPEGVTPILGLECAGEIVATGPNVMRYKPGHKVCALVSGGAYAEYVVAPEGQCMPVPSGLSYAQAACLPEGVLTVWANVFEAGRLKPEHVALIHGGSSGIGTFAIQMVTLAGAKAIVTVGSEEKAKACRELGAVLAINYKTKNFVKEVNHFTKEEGVNLVLDMIGADYIPRNLECMARGGRHITISVMHGKMASINMLRVMNKNIILTGSRLRTRSRSEKARLAREVESHIWPWIAQGSLKPVLFQSFALENVKEAHKVMESSAHIGKMVLTV